MNASIRRMLTTGLLAAAMVGATANAALAVDSDPDPFNCSSKVAGTMSTSPAIVDSGAQSTVSWTASATGACAYEVGFRVGTSFAQSQAVGQSGSKVFRPVIGTTYRLYADFGDHYAVLASRYVAITGETPVTVHLSSFKALDVQEEGGSSNGDEPWLMVFPIFADGRTINAADLDSASVRVFGAKRAHENLNRTGVFDGTTINIPTDTGWHRTVIQPVRSMPMSLGKQAAMVGVAVIALEEDGTPDDAAEAGRATARAEIARQLNALIRSATIPTSDQIEDLQDAVQDSVIDTIAWETLASFGLAGVVDPDDFIGAGFVRFSQAQIEAAGWTGIPISFTFTGDGAQYRISGAIRRG